MRISKANIAMMAKLLKNSRPIGYVSGSEYYLNAKAEQWRDDINQMAFWLDFHIRVGEFNREQFRKDCGV